MSIPHLVRLREDLRAKVRELNSEIKSLTRQIKRAEKKAYLARKVEQEIARKERNSAMLQMHQRGIANTEIASRVGLTRSRVFVLLKRMQSALGEQS